MVLHAHRAIWKERGLLNSNNKDIKHAPEILALLRAVTELKAIAITHRTGHQKPTSFIARGNRNTDATAKQAALKRVMVGPLLPQIDWSQYHPQYTVEDNQRAKE